MTYRILVTGSRDWKLPAVLESKIMAVVKQAVLAGKASTSEDIVIVHGNCPTGADAQADQMARYYDWNIEKHDANWALLGKAAGPKRNQKMVDLGADICLAFIGPSSKGAKGCAKMAEAAGIETKRIKMEY